MYRRIFTSQCGYQPHMKKQVTFRADAPVSFTVLRSNRTPVYSGVADRQIENASADEINYVGDFSEVTEEGLYLIATKELGESDTFAIGGNALFDVFHRSMAFYYLQRCGHDLTQQAAHIYAHKPCHTQIGHVYGSNETRDVSGGWHDAGDYGRYVGPGAMSVAQLLYALERNKTLCGSYRSPASIGYFAACQEPFTPAGTDPAGYLDELRYELDWMMKMQREDGALYHKASCASFCGFIMPDEETDDMVICPVSVTATADFAAVCAMAVRFFKDSDPAYAKKLEDAAKRAYAAMKGMELPGGFKNPKGVTTGEYGDGCDTDERYWAAAEFYKAFGDPKYREDFEAIAREQLYHGYGWANMGSYGNLAYISSERAVDEELKQKIRQSMIELADRICAAAEADGYGNSLTPRQYGWGCNMSVCNNGLHLYDAFILTGEQRYLDAAEAQLHYLLGRNPMGLCYVTGCGTHPIVHPHHRPSGNRGKAMPGMLSGGPCHWLADEAMRGMFTPETTPAPAKSLLDMTPSYSTNEVTIYWNSALLQLMASVVR